MSEHLATVAALAAGWLAAEALAAAGLAAAGSVAVSAAGAPRAVADFTKLPQRSVKRRDGRVVEGARLESVFRGNSNVGSNPTLSARIFARCGEYRKIRLTKI